MSGPDTFLMSEHQIFHAFFSGRIRYLFTIGPGIRAKPISFADVTSVTPVTIPRQAIPFLLGLVLKVPVFALFLEQCVDPFRLRHHPTGDRAT